METRTEIRNYISDKDGSLLYISLEKAKTYDVAKKMLNSFVYSQLSAENGKVYDLDKNCNKFLVVYKNSNNPNDVKTAIYDTIKRLVDKSDVLYQEINERCAKDEELSKGGNMFLSHLRMADRRREDIIRWLEKWSKEPVIKIVKDVPIRPKKEAKIYIRKMFEHLKSINYFGDNPSEETWNHACGVTEEPYKELITWNKGNFAMAVLVDTFFAPYNEGKNENRVYFEYDKEEAIHKFVIEHFKLPNGERMKYDSVKSERTRTDKRDKDNGKAHSTRTQIWNEMKVEGMF